ncbi:MAG: cytochrome c biogenesis protein [Puniceicoccales bacterium]|jgi:ABC-type uncharacterized transport system permease subunit|nr:cytochrome c biogenesis protein [Puniceicoccales bacterium]
MDFSARYMLLAGTLLYGAALVAALWRQRSGSRTATVLAAVALWLGFLVQFAGLHRRGGETHVFPLSNAFELLQMLAWGVVAIGGFLRVTFFLRTPVSLTAGLAAILGGAAFLNPQWDHSATAHFSGDPWIEFHVVMIVLGYCFLAAQALNALVFLLQNYSLERRRFAGIFRFLPPLRQVDRAGVQLLGAGVCLLSLGMIVGVVNYASGAGVGTGLKFVCATLVWAGYAAALFLRRKNRLLGKRFAVVSLALFAAAMLTLWPANAARHGTAPPAASVPSATPILPS